jgi:hypothetical protein
MRGLLADINILGHLRALIAVLEDDYWRDVWHSLNLPLYSFRDFGLATNASDALVWQKCQDEELVLLTGNRNSDGPDSLEAVLRAKNTPACLPVFTVGDTERVLQSKQYAERVVERLLEYVLDVENYRGTGRLYLP